MTDKNTLQQIVQELLFTDQRISDVLDTLGLRAIPEEIERDCGLVICAGCGLWVYRETVRNELCIDYQEAA